MARSILEIEGFHTVQGFYKEESNRYTTIIWLEIGNWNSQTPDQFYEKAALADETVPCILLDSSIISYS